MVATSADRDVAETVVGQYDDINKLCSNCIPQARNPLDALPAYVGANPGVPVVHMTKPQRTLVDPGSDLPDMYTRYTPLPSGMIPAPVATPVPLPAFACEIVPALKSNVAKIPLVLSSKNN